MHHMSSLLVFLFTDVKKFYCIHSRMFTTLHWWAVTYFCFGNDTQCKPAMTLFPGRTLSITSCSLSWALGSWAMLSMDKQKYLAVDEKESFGVHYFQHPAEWRTGRLYLFNFPLYKPQKGWSLLILLKFINFICKKTNFQSIMNTPILLFIFCKISIGWQNYIER